MMNKINVAIDGPAGAGKSTVAKAVAARLQYMYIDTGAMYRALTWKALNTRTNVKEESKLVELLANTSIIMDKYGQGNVYADNDNVTEAIRSEAVTANVSDVAMHPQVRKQMVLQQRQLAAENGAVLDGRDIGTVVLPNAELKIFLQASVEIRASRRHQEHLDNGLPSDLEFIKKDIERRDKIDSSREASPLLKAEDAVEIDSSNKSIAEVTDIICRIAEERIQSHDHI
ncbi:(d)CMP kinase [Alteribacillus sp. HJP-4]|uniref:(d)CMP kinase n=1 Tax=Alteribacillus sp. HJP-4 TaxID=2775394 RepID=UPI0035CD2BDF